jgi:gamma-glutamyltranspeptidase/glutathione hydrolase
MPVMAANVVATSQPLAAEAGLNMLRQGGNAVDAAVAAAITLTVVEPTANGIGSDGFALIWDGKELHGLNASGRAPLAWTPEYIAGKYPDLKTMPERGIDTVTIPGAVSQWVALAERFGRLPFAKLFAPAIHYARKGFLLSPITAASWAQQVAVIEEPDFRREFAPTGQAPAPGSSWTFPEQAETLAEIAASRGESFYLGTLAAKMVAHARALGGVHTLEDFARHRADWVTPISTCYHDVRLHEIPPNGQGLAALICLGILRHFGLKHYPVDSADSIHLQIEAMKLAFADTLRYLSDPASMDIPAEALLDAAYLKSRAALIRIDRAGKPVHGIPSRGGTVYLSTADESGMMVSLIQSNFLGFGSGIVVPGTGISLQNRGYSFVRTPGHANCVGPGKRPYQTIIPGFLTDLSGRPLLSFGVMGAHMQPQGHVQMVTRICDYGQNPQTASDAPRWLVGTDGRIGLEEPLAGWVGAELQRRGHTLAPAEAVQGAFGGAQLIWRTEGGYIAGSDHRKDGQAVGF